MPPPLAGRVCSLVEVLDLWLSLIDIIKPDSGRSAVGNGKCSKIAVHAHVCLEKITAIGHGLRSSEKLIITYVTVCFLRFCSGTCHPRLMTVVWDHVLALQL